MDHEDEFRAFLSGARRTRGQRIGVWVLFALVAFTLLVLVLRAIVGY